MSVAQALTALTTTPVVSTMLSAMSLMDAPAIPMFAAVPMFAAPIPAVIISNINR